MVTGEADVVGLIVTIAAEEELDVYEGYVASVVDECRVVFAVI